MIRFLQTPGPIKKIVLGGLLLVICGAMVITLVPGGLGTDFGFGGPGQGVLAKVGGEDVTLVEVQREAEQMIRQQFPRGGPQMSMLRPYFQSRAAENLINRDALIAEAKRMGFRVSDGELRDELQHGRYSAVFFPNGNFIGQDAYIGKLQEADLSVQQFESSLKNDILLDKIRNLIAGAATVSDAEVHDEFEKQNTKVKFEYAVLSKDDVMKGIHPTDSELKAFYDRNKASYANSIPEKRKIKYALIDTSALASQVKVTPSDLQSYYNQHREEYRVPEQVNVRHILIKTPAPGPDGKVDQKGVDAARKKAEDVLKQLKAGASFEALAKKDSDDPGSAANGGSLGWIQRGRTVPEFEKAAFSLPKGGTSGLVQSSYGFHIIHVDDKDQAHLKTLDEVKDQIEPILQKQKATQTAQSQADALLKQARSSNLEKAASDHGVKVVTTDFVSRNDMLPGVGPSPQLMGAVFNEPDKNAPVDEAQISQGFVIFQVTGVEPPATPTFEQIRDRVETEFKNERAAQLLSQKILDLADRAKAEHDLKKAAKELGATMKTSDFVLPTDQVPDIGAMSGPANVAFTMKPGEISGPIASNTGGSVLKVLDKQEPTPQEFADKKDETRESLLQNKETEAFGLFVSNLRDQMEKSGKIKINQEEMKNLTHASASDEGE